MVATTPATIIATIPATLVHLPAARACVATGVALSFTPTTMVIASAAPESHLGLASGLASSATQVGAALGTAGFTAIALTGGASGFGLAFTAAAGVSLVTALLGTAVVRHW